MERHLPTVRKVLFVLFVAAIAWACSGDTLEKTGVVIVDAGERLRDMGETMRDAGSSDALAQDQPCDWEIKTVPMPAPDTDSQPRPAMAIDSGWEPFAVDANPDFDTIYLRRCTS